jgi:hypothetical protein
LEKVAFTRFVRDLCTYYERKIIPTAEAIDAWHQRVEKIPAEPLEWIAKRIQANSEGFPKNLPNTVWEHFREWGQANPEKISRRSTICRAEHCNGAGYIFSVREYEKGASGEYVFRCLVCNQAQETTIPYFSNQHIRDGFKPVKQRKPEVTTHSTRELASMIGKPMEEARP